MSDQITIKIDGKEVRAVKGQTIMEAALDADIYIPYLCYHPELKPHGSCRICTVKVNGKPMAACTTPAEDGMEIINDDEELFEFRKSMIEMLFVEGNHYCMFCEMSGKCELQALGYRFGIMAMEYPYQFPERELDGSHPEVFLDRNRCILCGRCVSASRDLDGKNVFGFEGRGKNKKIIVNAETGLAETTLSVKDKAVSVCPVGAILVKDTAFRVPIGERQYDKEPIGSDIEAGCTREQ